MRRNDSCGSESRTITCMPVRVEFLGTDRPDGDFDALLLSAATLIADVVPGLVVEVKYLFDATSEHPDLSALYGRGHTEAHILDNGWAGSAGDGWWRGMTLLIPRELAAFLGEGPAKAAIATAAAVFRDVAYRWAEEAESAPTEIVRALASQYPRWAVAHLLADGMASFASHRRPDRPTHDRLAATIANVLEYFEELSAMRVEHEQLSMGVLITQRPCGNTPVFPDMMRRLKRTPLLANGHSAVIEVSPEGNVRSIVTKDQLITPKTDRALAAMNLLPLAALVHQGIGLQLRADGSMAAYAARPFMVKRGGRWRGLLWKQIADVLTERYEAVGARLFDAALRLSADGHGGILAIVDTLPASIHAKDNVAEARASETLKHPEWILHRLLFAADILTLPVAYLATLASIDGATLVTPGGALLAYGAVVPSQPAGAEGARSAAARALSEHGLVMKVSADGPITIYERGAERIEC